MESEFEAELKEQTIKKNRELEIMRLCAAGESAAPQR